MRGRILLTVLVAAAALAVAPSASAASTDAVDAATGTSVADCSRSCPMVLFGRGAGRGTIDIFYSVGSTPYEESCEMSRGVQCTFMIDDAAQNIYMRARPATGSIFKGWGESAPCVNPPGTPADRCNLGTSSPGTVCPVFTLSVNEPPDASSCPPPNIQIYKKGDGKGTVTGSSPSGMSETCAAALYSCTWTRWMGGETVTLTASATDGTFVRWDGQCTRTSGTTCEIDLFRTALVCPVFIKASAPPTDFACPGFAPPPPPPPAPNTRLTAGPSAKRATRSRRATFRFVSNQANSRFLCRLDARPWQTCRSPKTYTGLKPGTHTFRVRAVNAQGRGDETPAVRRWRIRR